MEIKKFALLYLNLLVLGLLTLSFQDILFIYNSESQVAKIHHFVPGPDQKFYKMGGSYIEKTLTPVVQYSSGGVQLSKELTYSCKDGCHKIGSGLTIFYNKENPSQVLVSSFEGFWKDKIYFLIIMAVLLVTALPYLYYVSKRPLSESNG